MGFAGHKTGHDGGGGQAVGNPVITFDEKEIDCTKTVFNPETGQDERIGFRYKKALDGAMKLEVFGTVNFKGYDLDFAKDVLVRFSGEANFFVEKDAEGKGGSVTIDGDVLPGNSFPDEDVLGIVAEKNFRMTGATQNIDGAPKTQVAAGLFYAGERAIVENSGVLFGTLVAADFCTTSNCTAGQQAKIVQVPGLEYRLGEPFKYAPNPMAAEYRIVSFERR